MPGIAGFTRFGRDGDDEILRRMRQLMKHRSDYVDDSAVVLDDIAGTRTHKNIIQHEEQPCKVRDVYVWMKGEFYNQEDLALTQRHSTRELTDPQILAELYIESEDFTFLRRIDGIFSAVIFDARKKVVCLLTDRYGFGYLYWTIQEGQLIWASELKAFLAYPEFRPVINLETLSDFFGTGHPLKSKSWFQDVQLVDPGSVVMWDIRSSRLTTLQYWSWDHIPTLNGRIDENELAEELGRLWKAAVEKRVNLTESRIGVPLSGGLDSRAILAAMPDLGFPIPTFTIGNKYCDDVRIARRVARLKGTNHQLVELNESNWINLRSAAVWWSDGHFDIKHMHGCVAIDKVIERYDVNMSGLSGGIIMGGLYADRSDGDRREEFELMQSRGRRFSPTMVITIDDVFFHGRCPFLDNSLVDFSLSIPSYLRRNAYIYKKMLVARFPNYYKNIAWQKTGVPVNAGSVRIKLNKVARDSRIAASKVVDRVVRSASHRNMMNRHNFHDYDSWLRNPAGVSFIEDVLFSDGIIYPDYVDKEVVDRMWDVHLKGGRRARKLLQYVTFEIWLQQVYACKFRDQSEFAALAVS